ncbi:MAG: type II toxin-antitoxin system VapC family toxin [Methylococcales bacterium]|jgi:PIN domain nuclease of toxin-antitoxin system|nr:type II toxin-antitoxin system VapC family toxin [Methylococcales bacterium]
MSEIILLDSHIWFWWITGEQKKYPKSWNQIIENSQKVGVSPVSCFELALAHSRNRLELPCSPKQWFEQALTLSGVELYPLTAEIAEYAVRLTPVHKDPFDRIIIATAIENNAQLLSVDKVFPNYPELKGRLILQ